MDVDQGSIMELTRQERVVLGLLQRPEGLTYKEIGEELGISWMTVRFHVHKVYEKLGIGGDGARARLVARARFRGRERRMSWGRVRRRLMEREKVEVDVDVDVIEWFVVSGGT